MRICRDADTAERTDMIPRKNLILVAVAVAAAVALAAPGCRKKKVRYVAIGTGGTTGVYYPVGGAIAKRVNDKADEYGIRMVVQSTAGSVFNINAVLKGDLEFGIAQSDRQYQAWNGLAEWKNDGPRRNLRSVCSLHPEAITLVAADDSGITTLDDLRGRRVNIGNAGSGFRGNAVDVLKAAGIDPQSDIIAESLKAAESPAMLQDGRIDAFFYTVGHPSGAIKEATAGQRRKVHFVPITHMDALLARSPYYAKTIIPISLYPSATNDADVATIGVMTTLITSADVDERIVYAVTKELFENLDRFKATHPALARLTRQGMLRGLTAPLHAGALKYYKEAGLDVGAAGP